MTDGLLTLAQWLSPSYPLGSFAYSHGLEALVASGTVANDRDLEGWLGTILRDGAGASDALFIAAAATGQRPIAEIDALAQAFAGSEERLTETLSQGKAFARVTIEVWGLELIGRCFPVVFGEAVGQQHLPLQSAISLYLQSLAGNLVSGAIRLGVTSQTGAQRLILQLEPVLAQVTSDAMAGDLSELKNAAFRSDIAAIKHETLQPRIFRT